jgi:uncharacterized protein (DUF1778 family)
MSASPAARSERLEARVTRELKQLIEQAAELEGRSITDFIVASTQAAARQVIQERELLKLGARDREVFVQALMNPPKPNEKLRQAVRRYHGIVR